MNFDPGEDQALLKTAVERFVADTYGAAPVETRRMAQAGAAGFGAAHWARLAETGLLGLAVSASGGGLGGGRVEVAVTMEAIGHGLVAEPLLEAAIIPGMLLDAASHAAQQSTVLEGLVAGASIVVLAHAERAARFDLDHVDGAAEASGTDVAIHAGKTAVLVGGGADWLIVSARDASGVTGFWLVPAAAPGVDRRPYRLADGSLAAEVTLRGVVVPAGNRLAVDTAHFTAVIAMARLAACAEMLGLMTRLFETTLDYVKTRRQFGQPLGSFQVIQHRMTDAYVLIEQARSHLLRAALAPDARFARAAAGAKAFIADAAITVAHTAVQMHGGMGITDELLVGHALKRIRVLALVFGDAGSALDDYARAA